MRAARTVCLLCILAGCASPDGEDAAAAPENTAAQSLAAIHGAARDNCVAAGFSERTGGFARCIAAFHAREAARARAEARTLMERAALRRGLCIDPVRFALARCIDI